MNKFLNEKLMPVAAKIGSNKGMIAIRDGITLAMPLIIISSDDYCDWICNSISGGMAE